MRKFYFEDREENTNSNMNYVAGAIIAIILLIVFL